MSILRDKVQIGDGMDEKTGYAAARRAAMVLTANILCVWKLFVIISS